VTIATANMAGTITFIIRRLRAKGLSAATFKRTARGSDPSSREIGGHPAERDAPSAPAATMQACLPIGPSCC
jgi:hypothetical protein